MLPCECILYIHASAVYVYKLTGSKLVDFDPTMKELSSFEICTHCQITGYSAVVSVYEDMEFVLLLVLLGKTRLLMCPSVLQINELASFTSKRT